MPFPTQEIPVNGSNYSVAAHQLKCPTMKRLTQVTKKK